MAVRDDVEDVIRALQALAGEHGRRGSEFYYTVRNRFNVVRAAGGLRGLYTPDMAAMLIYLNRTGFNGLFRQNRAGEFNVPAGRYVNPRICDALTFAPSRQPGSVQVSQSSLVVRRHSRRGGTGRLRLLRSSVCAAEPHGELRALHRRRIHAFDQIRLQQAVITASRRGAAVVVSNSSAPEIGRATPPLRRSMRGSSCAGCRRGAPSTPTRPGAARWTSSSSRTRSEETADGEDGVRPRDAQARAWPEAAPDCLTSTPNCQRSSGFGVGNGGSLRSGDPGQLAAVRAGKREAEVRHERDVSA